MLTTKTFRSCGYQLHQSLRTRARSCVNFVLRLLPDDRVNESWIDALLLANFKDDAVQDRISGGRHICRNTINRELIRRRYGRECVAEQESCDVTKDENCKQCEGCELERAKVG